MKVLSQVHKDGVPQVIPVGPKKLVDKIGIKQNSTYILLGITFLKAIIKGSIIHTIGLGIFPIPLTLDMVIIATMIDTIMSTINADMNNRLREEVIIHSN